MTMIYYDNAATTFPKPSSVYSAVMRCMQQYCGNPGRGSHSMSVAAAEKVYECRCEIASLFGSGSPENVIFMPNATYALNLAIKSLVRRGDHILISNIEHNSVLRPVAALAARGITYSIYNAKGTAEEVIASVKAAVRHNTRLLVACHASNICGIELPIKALGDYCRSRHIAFAVDASQSAGSREVNIRECGISALCAPGHKGLYGPQGSGFVLFGDAYRNAADFPSGTLTEGGSGLNSLEIGMPELLPERFEAGTLSTPAIAGLCEGIKTVKRLGVDRIFAHESLLYRRLREMLSQLPSVQLYAQDEDNSSILLFNIKNLPASEAAARLDDAGICVRSGFHCSPLAHRLLETGTDGAVRVSFSPFSSAEELELLYKAVKSME